MMIRGVGRLFKSPVVILFIILLVGIFFRVYRSYEFMLFGHDQDLAAWIVKDMVIDKHFRLIGQETSIGGLFIGGIFYYGLLPFYLLFNMHPIGSMPFPIIISALCLVSFYFVVSKLYSVKAGLLAALFFALSINQTFLDRWSVPTQPTLLWSVWFLYVVVSFGRGNFKVLPILPILSGLIWHIHIAFIPLLGLIPIAWIISGKSLKSIWQQQEKKILVISLLMAGVLFMPLFVFEFRHNFQQFWGILEATGEERGAYSGLMRAYLILENLARTILFPFTIKLIPVIYSFSIFELGRSFFILIIFGGLGVFLWQKKLLKSSDGLLFLAWFGVVFFGQFLTKRAISEYYFYNLLVIVFLVGSLIINFFLSFHKLKLLVMIGLCFYALLSFYRLVSYQIPNREYFYIEQVITFIKSDAVKNNYSCLGLTFFGEPGVGVGFRYPIWYFQLPVITAGGGVPMYNIAIPARSASSEVNAVFGDYGVILPERGKKYDFAECSKPERQLLELNGFTK